jgi:transcription termination/antitermination protein NusA
LKWATGSTFLLGDMKSDFLLAISQLAAEKNLPRDIVLDAIEAALTSAYRREGEEAPNVYVRIDPESGDIRAYEQKSVVDEVEDDNVEMSVEDARRYKPDARAGDVLDFERKIPENAGRIAAQTAKQVVLQRLREAERDAVYEEYAGKEGELVVGTVQRIESRQIIVELGRGTEAALPISEQIRNEHLRPGQRAKVVILEVMRAAKGPPIIVSRSHRSLIRRLFELEVPEIRGGTVEIKSIAREGGHRSKIAVHTRVPSIDPIGACVGPRGARVQNVVNELGGERIDIIKWDPDPVAFITNALSPAQILETVADPDNHRALVTVPDSMMSLAIGKEGQNARLAAKLTGWNIDIQSQSTAESRAAGEDVSATSFAPAAPGEEPDIDLVAEYVEPEPEVVAPTPVITPVTPAERPAASLEEPGEEEVVFAAAVASMPVPDRDERESEDYGEEEDEEEEEYEIPAAVVAEERPSSIRFAEDVLPRRVEEEEPQAKKAAPKKARRAPRFIDEVEEDMEEIDYSGRIH